MKKVYISPDFQFRRINFIKDVLVISDQNKIDQEIPTGGETVPDDDPFA